jgi:type III restriction enzyme
LIDDAAKAMKDELQMPGTRASSVRSTTYGLNITEEGIDGSILREREVIYGNQVLIPDALSYIQNKTELTRDTILQILKKSGRVNELLINPQMFLDNAVKVIRHKLQELMIDGIKYEKIGNRFYEMTLFDDSDFEIYIDNFTHTVEYPDKTIYENYIPLDSGVENQFAADCESSEDVEFYFKLPTWFEITTPIGKYRPDWAVVLKGEKKIYFVAETKGDEQELRGSELMKIKCGIAHFKKFEDVKYKRVEKVRELRF